MVHTYAYVRGSIFLFVMTKHRKLQEVRASCHPGTEFSPRFSAEAPTDGKKNSAPCSCHEVEVNVTDDLHFVWTAVALELD